MAEFTGKTGQTVFKPDLFGDGPDTLFIFLQALIGKHSERASPVGQRHEQVLMDALVLKGGRFLEFAADAKLGNLCLGSFHPCRAPPDITRVGPGLASDNIHEGCLASAIRPDDGPQLSLANAKLRALIAPETVKRHRDIIDMKKLAHQFFLCGAV